MSTTTVNSQQEAQLLIDKILKGKELHDIFTGYMREKLSINNQSISDLETRYKIQIPSDLNTSSCREMDVKLLNLLQEASLHYAIANAKLQMIKRSNDSRYRDRFIALVEDYRSKNPKLPAASTLENLARAENDLTESAEAIAQVEKVFWQDILEHLSSCRKIIENASINIATELKAVNAANHSIS